MSELNARVVRDAKNPKLLAKEIGTGKTYLVGREYGVSLAKQGKIKIIGDEAHGDNISRAQSRD